MGMGIGAAMTGLRPIVEGMNMGFLLLAFNQVGHTAAGVVLGGGWSGDPEVPLHPLAVMSVVQPGATHHRAEQRAGHAPGLGSSQSVRGM